LLNGKKSSYLSVFNQDYTEVNDLCSIIQRTIAENPPISIKEGGLIKEGIYAELDYQKSLLSGGREWIENFEKREKERTNIKSLKIGYSKTFGYFIEITHSNTNLVPSDYIRKQTLVNAERYITPELKKYEEEVLTAQSKSIEIEYKIFCDLREYAKEYITLLRHISQNIAALDVILSFAGVAVEYNYIRPNVDNSNVLMIKGGRHPVIEQLLPMGEYVANDLNIQANVDVNTDKTQFVILTGPNMAGKSTYMRQNALITILAQIGSFVPAREAQIGIIDKIFTRVGSVDDLSMGQSTFMVEMNETAMILNSATEKSLILLDEIGRGTSTYDGVAIAWSVAEFIATQIKARTIFATHYHELNIMCNSLPQIKNYRMTIEEINGEIKFLRQVLPGGTSRSYGIQVAKMAGLPEDVISTALNLMNKMQKNYSAKLGSSTTKAELLSPQLSLFID
jgi:DNA mismatch repair protein MutS